MSPTIGTGHTRETNEKTLSVRDEQPWQDYAPESLYAAHALPATYYQDAMEFAKQQIS
jgi:hypothetical protein